MKLVFFGAPGAGKGTISKRLNEKYLLPQISTGDLFRENIKNKTELGLKVSSILEKGELVPDRLTISIVESKIKDDECKNGYILDGFPRTLNQAESWEKISPIDKAIYFDITDKEVIDRLCGRRVCPKCGQIYHILFNKPKNEGKCNNDNESLYIRPDDKEEAINNRLDVYHKQTEPLIEYYTNIGKIIKINAINSLEEVYNEITSKLNLK
jgi:adenylate kinase